MAFRDEARIKERSQTKDVHEISRHGEGRKSGLHGRRPGNRDRRREMGRGGDSSKLVPFYFFLSFSHNKALNSRYTDWNLKVERINFKKKKKKKYNKRANSN